MATPRRKNFIFETKEGKSHLKVIKLETTVISERIIGNVIGNLSYDSNLDSLNGQIMSVQCNTQTVHTMTYNGEGGSKIEPFDLTPSLKPGKNVITVISLRFKMSVGDLHGTGNILITDNGAEILKDTYPYPDSTGCDFITESYNLNF